MCKIESKMIIEVIYDDLFVSLAEEKAAEMGALKNSIKTGEGNVAGFLGEFIVADCFGGVVKNTYDYDLIINGKRVDVKTKRVTYVPKGDYLCAISAFNTRQDCDSYYFVSINLETKTAYLLGGLRKEVFYSIASFHRKGEIDPTNGWDYKADTYNVPISKLKQLQIASRHYSNATS